MTINSEFKERYSILAIDFLFAITLIAGAVSIVRNSQFWLNVFELDCACIIFYGVVMAIVCKYQHLWWMILFVDLQ